MKQPELPGGIGLHAAAAIGHTRTVTSMPPPTVYHRWLGWHATAMRRAATVLTAGLIAALVLSLVVDWGLALVGGWDAAEIGRASCRERV